MMCRPLDRADQPEALVVDRRGRPLTDPRDRPADHHELSQEINIIFKVAAHELGRRRSEPTLRIAMKIFFYVLAFAALTVATTVASHAQELEKGFELIRQKFHSPSQEEIEKLREMIYERDLEQSALERYAIRCEGFLIEQGRPEHFVTIHAVDKELGAVRHVVHRTFTDEDDPRLRISIEGPAGYTDTRVHGPILYPFTHDKLRLGDKIYLTNVEAEGVDNTKLKFTGQDRNFDPITSAFLPYSGFFEGGSSKRPVSKCFLIDKLTPNQVAATGDYFVAKTRLRDTKGNLLGCVVYRAFREGLPVATEFWFIGDNPDKGRLQHRTLTKWEPVKEMRFPVRMEATQVVDGHTTAALDATFAWRFDAEVPDRLFQVKDVQSKTAMQW